MLTRSLGELRGYGNHTKFVLESQQNAPDSNRIEKYFDFSITMSHKSNFQYRPNGVTKFKERRRTNKSINYAEGKTKTVAWFASNCVKHRIDFVKRLQQSGIRVHVGGGCARHMKDTIKCSRKTGYDACTNILKDFKFYFSAENGFCTDYITEKYYIQPFLGNAIPIVLGGGNYSDHKNAIPNSYINPLDFLNFDKFAAHIKMLDRNDTAYNEYFNWKDSWFSGWRIDFVKSCSSFICDICTNLHEGGGNLVGGKLSQQFSTDDCKAPTKKFFEWYHS